MCDICHRTPCDSRCPNAPEPTPELIFICSGCGDGIYENADYYDILGEQFCVHCMRASRRTAVYEP